MITSLNVAIAKYNGNRKNDMYIIGFLYHDNIYMWKTKKLIKKSLFMDRGDLRMNFTETIKKKVLKSKNCIYFCTIDELVTFIDRTKKCCCLGEAFERAITEYYGQKWFKDWIPYYKGCDLYVNDIGISIKFAHRCTVARQKSLYYTE